MLRIELVQIIFVQRLQRTVVFFALYIFYATTSARFLEN